MGRYVIRRLLWTGLVILVVTFLTFLIFFVMMPGNKAVRFAGKQPTPEIIAEVEKQFGLDKPVYAVRDLRSAPQVWRVDGRRASAVRPLTDGRLVLGDGDGCPVGIDGCGWPGLGISYDSRSAVRQEIIERLPRTLALAIGAAIVWLVMGVTIGVISALKRGSAADRGAMGFALFGVSAPVFWLGLMALFIFWKKLGIDALGTGYVEFAVDPWGWFTHLLLPWFVLALLYAALYARMTRGNLIDVMGEDYIRTARAKGLPERTVVFKHGLRASLTPIVTMLGMDFALLIGGAIITETVFNIQGLGYYAVSSARSQDFPSIAGIVHRRGVLRRDHEPLRRHRLRVPRSAGAAPVSAPGGRIGEPLLEVRDLEGALPDAGRDRQGRRRADLLGAPRRDLRDRRRVRLGEERHVPDGARTHQPQVGDRLGRDPLQGRRPDLASARAASEDPRQGARDDLPGSVRVAPSHVPRRRPARRGRPASTTTCRKAAAREPRGRACSRRSGSRTRASASGTTRTSTRAECGSAP